MKVGVYRPTSLGGEYDQAVKVDVALGIVSAAFLSWRDNGQVAVGAGGGGPGINPLDRPGLVTVRDVLGSVVVAKIRVRVVAGMKHPAVGNGVFDGLCRRVDRRQTGPHHGRQGNVCFVKTIVGTPAVAVESIVAATETAPFPCHPNTITPCLRRDGGKKTFPRGLNTTATNCMMPANNNKNNKDQENHTKP